MLIVGDKSSISGSLDDLLKRINLVDQVRTGEIDITVDTWDSLFRDIVIWQEEYLWHYPVIKEEIETAMNSPSGPKKRIFFEFKFLFYGLRIGDNYIVTLFDNSPEFYDAVCEAVRNNEELKRLYSIPIESKQASDRPWTYLKLKSKDIYDDHTGIWKRAQSDVCDTLLENPSFPGSAEIDIINDARETGKVIMIAHGEPRGIATFVKAIASLREL